MRGVRVALGSLYLSAQLSAQQPTDQARVTLHPGDLVRVTTDKRAARPITGLLARLAADSLLLEVFDTVGTTHTTVVRRREIVRLPDIRQIERSQGVSRPRWRYAKWGAVIGGGFGAVIGAVSYKKCEGFCLLAPTSRGENAAFYGVPLTLFGMILGAAVAPETTRWGAIDLTMLQSPISSDRFIGLAVRMRAPRPVR